MLAKPYRAGDVRAIRLRGRNGRAASRTARRP
jgi:hypothetical protein